MTLLGGAITPDGAIVRVEVGVSRAHRRALQQAGHPVPPPVVLDALLDTGAETTCFDSQAVNALQLPHRGFVIVNAPALTGWLPRLALEAGLTVIHPSGVVAQNWVIPDQAIVELPLNAIGYEMILGRDVLTAGRLDYNGRAGTFTLEY
jgi:hypothetical protein